VKLYQYIVSERKEYVLTKQLFRCGTSIGANIAEANGAISKADFSAKVSNAYKESLETKYWLSLLKYTGYLIEKEYDIIHADVDELSKMMFSILRTTERIGRNSTALLTDH
jgi:four helix bundle protein